MLQFGVGRERILEVLLGRGGRCWICGEIERGEEERAEFKGSREGFSGCRVGFSCLLGSVSLQSWPLRRKSFRTIEGKETIWCVDLCVSVICPLVG